MRGAIDDATELATELETKQAAGAADWRAGGFGVYVHWPFCQAKCPYCDFNSHVVRTVDQRAWRDGLVSEVSAAHKLTPGRAVDTVFFGGGTPSLMPPETVAAVVDAIAALWGLREDAEITLEANPTSVEAGRFAGYAAAGVNRVSMGVQALRDDDLQALGRLHDVAEARAAFDVARAAFDRVSFDLIYARMGQTPDAWADELREALDMAVDHLSLYQLTIEPGTAFAARHALGKLATPPDDASAAMYEITQELCAAAGLPAYEISNHARPGAESRHNRVYWRYGDYVGVGPGAHGRVTLEDGRRAPTVASRDPSAWLAAVAEAGHALTLEPALTEREQAEEMAIMGLRLVEGISEARFARLAGAPLPSGRLASLAADGLIARAGGRLVATPQGRLLLDHVLRTLLMEG